MLHTLSGRRYWLSSAEGMDLLSGIYACICTFVSLWISINWYIIFIQESVRNAGSSFLITPVIIPHGANVQQRLTSRRVNKEVKR
jgi:hypothetical protein